MMTERDREKINPTENFPAWYNRIVKEAGLAEYGPARGTIVIRPYAYAIWENIVDALDGEIKQAGVENAYFPLFIPMSLLQTEQEHIEGFEPHLAVVTHGGGKRLKEPLAVRPTSETIMYPFYKNWIQSHRDLPLLINQWCNIVRWELRTTPFLRTLEFLWQEGHTAHATQDEAWQEVIRALEMYQKVYQEYLAIPGRAGLKSDSEKFAGADATTTFEILMPDGKALQGCTSHLLGQNFSKAFEITFLDRDGELKYVHQTSWGFTTRSIGALIGVHGDEKGIRIPPKIAPIQVIVVPIPGKNGFDVRDLSYQVVEVLQEAGIRVKIDDSDQETPGSKFHKWETRGVPIRIEIGPRELENREITVFRRDENTKKVIPNSFLTEDISELLIEIQKNMFLQAREKLLSNTRSVETYEDFKNIMRGPRGMIRAFWCEDPRCEELIKEETKASNRCLEFSEPEEEGNCVYCGEGSRRRWIFAQAY